MGKIFNFWLLLWLLLFFLPSAWAGGGTSYTYYAKLVTNASGTGMGKVYCTAEKVPQSSSYATTSTATAKSVVNATSADILFYAYAEPSDGYEWAHWSKTENGSSVSADNPYTVTVTAKSKTENNPTTETLYAVFKKKEITPREPIERPTAATGLVYDGTVQTGVAVGEHYTLSGTCQAKDAGSYEATVTPASGYCWPDKSYGALKLSWSIARRPVTVSVVPTGKTEGEEEPVYETRAEGFVSGDDAEAAWKVWRTNLVEQTDGSLAPDEAVGTYDLLVAGTTQTANYSISYVNGVGAFEIRVAGPTMPTDDGTLAYDPTTKEVVVTPDAGVKDVEIVNMPDDATAQVPVSVDTVKGVTSNQVVVVAEATNVTGTVKVDITAAFKIAETPSGVTIELSEDPAAEVEVNVAGTKETVKVTPELTESGDAVAEPLAVADEDVALGVKTIPGLTYHLKRSTAPGGEGKEVASETAKGTRTKLTDPMDGEKPSQAFYVIEVTK